MNFLAHLYLSGNHEKILIGNFIADFVKGKVALANFESEIVLGIELHRAIDAFTDSHSIVKQSKARLSPKYRHYSGVIVDMFYDHFLAANWNNYNSIALPLYAQSVYALLGSHELILPAGAKRMLPYMSKHDWLVSYSTTEGIQRALLGMAKRTPYESKMEEATTDLINSYNLFQEEFKMFFPILANFCESWRQQNSLFTF